MFSRTMNCAKNHIAYQLKLHRFPDFCAVILKVDSKSHQITTRIPISENGVEVDRLLNYTDDSLRWMVEKHNHINFDADSSVRVVRIGGIEQFDPLTCGTGDVGGDLLDAEDVPQSEAGHGEMLMTPHRESKVPNIPLMIRCQNCDTNFPTKYQFQRHQCEFNADKVVLKPNVDPRDSNKGMRPKFDCKTCGKQFVSKNNLERHLTSHDEENVNICEYCNKQFVSENRLRIHKENHCKKTGDISKFYRSDVTVWRCTKCFQVFATESCASSHVDNCTDIVTPHPGNDSLINSHFKEDEVGAKDPLAMDTHYEEGEISSKASRNPYVDKVCTEILLQCEFCNRVYASKQSLLWHQDSHTTSDNYNCVRCKKTFESFTAATKHWLTECANVANQFYLPKLTYCKGCNRTFKSHEILYLHKIKKKHYTPKKHIYCDDVDAQAITKDERSFEPPPAIEVVKLEGIGVPGVSAKKVKLEVASSLETVENKATIIQLIEDVLDSSKSLGRDNSDEDAQNGDDCDDDDDDSDKCSQYIKSEASSEVNLPACEDDSEKCSKKKRGRKRKQASQSSKAKKCMEEVQAGYKYQCERCVALFNNVMDMEVHRNKEHPANYKCEECDQVVHSSKALMIHNRAHQSLKPYVCEICKRSYSQTSHLWQHMRFHQGIKPFACPHEGCEARYTIRPDLKDHIRKVHTRERPFKCTVCDKSFLTGSVYYQHRLIHTNDRRYACDICDKRFFRADALNNHRRIHTDERPYPCSVCGRNFRQKGDRNKHVRTQHPDCQI